MMVLGFAMRHFDQQSFERDRTKIMADMKAASDAADHSKVVEIGRRYESVADYEFKKLYEASKFVLDAEAAKRSAAETKKQAATSPGRTASGAHIINGDSWFGASSKELFEKLVQYSVQGDSAAFGKLMTAGLLTGETTMFKNGEEVLLADTAIFSGMIKVRRKGDTQEYWTNIEATK